VSNLVPLNDWNGFIKPSVQIGEVKIIGYCTNKVVWGTAEQQALRENTVIDIHAGEEQSVKEKHKNRLRNTLKNEGVTPILVLACHDDLYELNFLDRDKDFLKFSSRIVIGGHTHIPDSTKCNVDRQQGSQVKVSPLALGYSAVVIKFYPFSNIPGYTSGEAEWSHLTPKSGHGNPIYINDEKLTREKNVSHEKKIIFHDWYDESIYKSAKNSFF
jgi:hypothetical protein